MKQNTKEKKIAWINYYKLDNKGEIVYAYGEEMGAKVSIKETSIYEINKKMLANFTCTDFAEKVFSGQRHYNLYYEDRDTIAVVGRTWLEFATGLAYVLEAGIEAFAGDNADKWCRGIYVAF